MIKLGIFCGGRSDEHEVSVLSAGSVIEAINKAKYEIAVVYITRDGYWYATKQLDCPISQLPESGEPVQPSFKPGQSGLLTLDQGEFWPLDVVFPLLHGPYGEDGRLQGLLDWCNLPYIGSDVAASALGMNKHLSKIIFAQNRLPQVDYLVGSSNAADLVAKSEEQIGYPCIVKPVNLGSSIGINRANEREELVQAIQTAQKFSGQVIIEKFILAREIECAVMGNERPEASSLGEIVHGSAFYDYETKYSDNSAQLIVDAALPPESKEEIQKMALAAYQALGCKGLARVDFFYEEKGNKIYINEINTLPGLTKYSMYPKLWEHKGVNYSELIDRLVELALNR